MPNTKEPLLVRALRGLETERRPVWLMRQAGRYLPIYQKVRKEVDFLSLCRRPDLSFTVSMEPVERFGLDAAIVFSDILIPLEAMGLCVEFGDKGPQIPTPLRTAWDVKALTQFDPHEKTPWILETIGLMRAALPPETPVIGFSGAPFTLATYAVEGKITKNLNHIKTMRWQEPTVFRQLLKSLAQATVPYLVAQARAGASVLQVFDTWAGQMSREDWLEFCVPPLRLIFGGVLEELGADCPPLVLYSRGTSGWLDILPETGADAFSVDWSIPLGEAKSRLGGRPVQGNLDPTALFGTPESIKEATKKMLASVEGKRGVVANLGHGVLVGTPPDNVQAFVDAVQGK